jgi:SAM-dependent methyltransferase
MLDELAHAGPEHLDPAFVAGYDRKQGYPDPAEDLAAFELSVLCERAAAAGRTNLACVQAGFLSYGRQGPPVDGVHTRNALHQLPDFFKALALERIARILRPGGVLRLRDLIYDFRPAEAPAVFQGWLDNASAGPADGYTAADYAEHIRTEFSTFRWLLEPMLAAAGFEIISANFERRLYGAYTCIKS